MKKIPMPNWLLDAFTSEMAEDHRMSAPPDLLFQGSRTKGKRPGALYLENYRSFWYPQHEADNIFAELESEITALEEVRDHE